MRIQFQKSRILGVFAVILIAACIVLIQSCGNDFDMQPKGNYISGYALFVDSNFIHTGGYYAAALYSSETSPFASIPITTEKIDLGAAWPWYYRIDWDGQGSFYVAIVWVHDPNPGNEKPMILGTLGCDTARSCNTNTVIPFPNFSGANFNIICWADTVHCLN